MTNFNKIFSLTTKNPTKILGGILAGNYINSLHFDPFYNLSNPVK